MHRFEVSAFLSPDFTLFSFIYLQTSIIDRKNIYNYVMGLFDLEPGEGVWRSYQYKFALAMPPVVLVAGATYKALHVPLRDPRFFGVASILGIGFFHWQDRLLWMRELPES